MRNKNKIFYVSILIFILSPLFGKEYKHAFLDLKEVVDDKESFIISVDGEWEFYWKEFLEYEDLYAESKDSAILVNVPSYWTDYEIGGEKPDRKGYATYRKKIYLHENHPEYSD